MRDGTVKKCAGADKRGGDGEWVPAYRTHQSMWKPNSDIRSVVLTLGLMLVSIQ